MLMIGFSLGTIVILTFKCNTIGVNSFVFNPTACGHDNDAQTGTVCVVSDVQEEEEEKEGEAEEEDGETDVDKVVVVGAGLWVEIERDGTEEEDDVEDDISKVPHDMFDTKEEEEKLLADKVKGGEDNATFFSSKGEDNLGEDIKVEVSELNCRGGDGGRAAGDNNIGKLAS